MARHTKKRTGNTGDWYTRREGVVRGPFPAGEISRYILLGRIRLDDDLSRDRLTWSQAATMTGLLPREMLNLSSWDDYQRYIEARMRIDERHSERRRDTCPHCQQADGDRRKPGDRRRLDNLPVTGRYIPGSQGARLWNRVNRGGRLRMMLLALLLVSLVFAWLVPVSR